MKVAKTSVARGMPHVKNLTEINVITLTRGVSLFHKTNWYVPTV